MIYTMSPSGRERYLNAPKGIDSTAILTLGGCTFGLHWTEIVLAPESIHQNMNFSGYPIGGLDFHTITFGTIESVCKAQGTYAASLQARKAES